MGLGRRPADLAKDPFLALGCGYVHASICDHSSDCTFRMSMCARYTFMYVS